MTTNDHHWRALLRWLSDRYGETRGRFLAARLARAIRRTGDGCISHLRACNVADAVEVAAYDETRVAGCCGSKDIDLEFRPAGQPDTVERYKVGFNYGH